MFARIRLVSICTSYYIDTHYADSFRSYNNSIIFKSVVMKVIVVYNSIYYTNYRNVIIIIFRCK